ncbi:hypothetical protein MCEJIRE27_01442 [Candidatus Nanopelagicaceae bacterium]
MRTAMRLILAIALLSTCSFLPLPADAAPKVCGGEVQCSAGDTGPGGGIVFYTTGTPFACGATLATFCNTLEAAPKNWSGGSSDGTRYWNQYATAVAGIGQVSSPTMTTSQLGLGLKNSIAMAAADTSTGSAAVSARAYGGGGLSDWYVPTMAELRVLCQWSHGETITLSSPCTYTNALNTGVPTAYTFSAGSYQSSTQSTNPGSAQWHQNFVLYGSDGNAAEQSTWQYAATSFYTRPIRAFMTGTASISLDAISGSLNKGSSISIVATVSTAGIVRFFASGKRIPNCLAVSTVTSGTITATCGWKPPLQGSVTLTATLTPAFNGYPPVTSPPSVIGISRRSTKR